MRIEDIITEVEFNWYLNKFFQPNYFYRKYMGATNEVFNFDVRVWRVDHVLLFTGLHTPLWIWTQTMDSEKSAMNHQCKLFTVYSFFEISCRKKCTRQSWKALRVVLSSLFFKEIWKSWHGKPWKCVCECERKATKVGSTATVVRNSLLIISHITFLGNVACTFFPTTFLEIAVYSIHILCLVLSCSKRLPVFHGCKTKLVPSHPRFFRMSRHP